MLVYRYCSFSNEGPACSTSSLDFSIPNCRDPKLQAARSVNRLKRTQILGPVKMHVLKVRCFFRKNRNKGSSKVGRVFVVFSCIFPQGGPSQKPLINDINMELWGPYKQGEITSFTHIFFEAIYRGPICKTPLITGPSCKP